MRDLGLVAGQPLGPDTLLILDEIQEIPEALTSLKYICETARELPVAAGSLLGLSVHSGTGFPVGKVDVLKMYPMTFYEFVWAQKGEDAFKALTESKMEELASLHSLFKDLFFKLFVVDCGLLGAMTSTPPEGILVGENIFEEYKGAFTEQFVLQQMLSTAKTKPFYFSADDSRQELNFLLQCDNRMIPVEVKAEENLRAKSLRQFVLDHEGTHGVRLSMSPYREQDWMTNYPLYAAERIV